MGRAWIAANAAAQPALLPADARDLLPVDHLAFQMMALVDELDLSRFEAAYRSDGRGRPPFAPRVMLTLILYCRAKKLMSGRQVAAACFDDVGARLITGNRYPDRSTIDRFLDIHATAIIGLLPQTLRLGHAEDLVDVSVVAGDGTKLAANASMGATVDETDLRSQITDLQQQLATAQQQWIEHLTPKAQVPTLFENTDTDTDTGRRAATPDTTTSDPRWRRIKTLTKMLHDRQAALTRLQTHPASQFTAWQDRLKRDQQRVEQANDRLQHTLAKVHAIHERRSHTTAAGGKPRGGWDPPPSPDDDSRVRRARAALAKATARAQATTDHPPSLGRINTTDPTSAIMPSKQGGYDQHHNIQALASKGQFILAINAHPNATDTQALTGLLKQARANLDTAAITDPIGAALFDTGYASTDNFTTPNPPTCS
ncbi:hypothetical protein Pflav_044240 [Phytohabitans flavus]|uniref:Transposase InsH N-terminal domain-containing protein n=2 Tax=Phytohabitans flavus TaxID=1076124 RepID=A0A6F8XVZ6_9ACTN|nr:transposase [Phytohabitans flavus]BCB78014.1 hypothetical protein Pflav_044240 [Phytohabitans flavus]